MMSIDTAIDKASKFLMQYWPLNAFIATNPLWELRDKAFFDVATDFNFKSLMKVGYYYECYQKGKILDQDILQAIKFIEERELSGEELTCWITQSRKETLEFLPSILLSQQVDEYEFQKPIVWIKERIFKLLRDYFGLMQYKKINLLEFWYKHNGIQAFDLTHLQSMTVREAITFLVKALAISESSLVEYFEAIFLQVYGWAGFMNWRNHHPKNPWLPGQDICELLLLFWLTYEYVIAKDINKVAENVTQNFSNLEQKKDLKNRYIWQTAFELHYFDQLNSKLNTNFVKEKKEYDAQFIFCIDTRSEGFRRHLELQGAFQTFGFAGFFGVIFNLDDEGQVCYQAPALVEATHVANLKKQKNKLEKLLNNFKQMMGDAKKQLTSPFALFEMMGFWYLFFMLFKTVCPKLKVKDKPLNIKVDYKLSIEKQFQVASSLLNSIGMVSNFSPYVIVCAHQTDNVNNPFKSSLNCGACGGNSGVPNALVVCEILNNEAVRLKLREINIDIPQKTQFIPASHHTSYDRLEILQGKIPAALKKSIDQAAKNLRKEKSSSLPGSRILSEREQSWSELIPELGLINNSCIVVAPRALTFSQNLERKAFLHSYEPSLDQDGDILTGILSAPVIVAHWINSQYYFSSTSPELFGSGNKAIHNVLPNIGVLEGNLSDLKVGLPLQSTHFQSKLIHEPRRLVVVVYAAKHVLEKAIQNSPDFKFLLDNQWIYLKHIELKAKVF